LITGIIGFAGIWASIFLKSDNASNEIKKFLNASQRLGPGFMASANYIERYYPQITPISRIKKERFIVWKNNLRESV